VTVLIVVLVLIAVLVIAGALLVPRMRSRQLQQRFGPEYDRTVQSTGDRQAAERDLQERAQRRRELDIRPLDPAARDRYAQRWRQAQERFVDEPDQAVAEADTLVQEVMRERGYPTGDFEQQARDVSVDHGDVVHEYHAAHELSQLSARGQASTEQLREAMVHYRTLFEELLGEGHRREAAR
jgi:hypothetical protein